MEKETGFGAGRSLPGTAHKIQLSFLPSRSPGVRNNVLSQVSSAFVHMTAALPPTLSEEKSLAHGRDQGGISLQLDAQAARKLGCRAKPWLKRVRCVTSYALCVCYSIPGFQHSRKAYGAL